MALFGIYFYKISSGKQYIDYRNTLIYMINDIILKKIDAPGTDLFTSKRWQTKLPPLATF